MAVAMSAQNPLLLCEQRLAGAALPCKSQTRCHPASRGSWGAWGIDNVRTDNVGTGNVGVSALDTPKLEEHCLFVFGKGFKVDTQHL